MFFLSTFDLFISCSNALHVLRPSKAPGFVYSWLELISHRIFIARMLAVLPQQKVSVLLKSLEKGLQSLTEVYQA